MNKTNGWVSVHRKLMLSSVWLNEGLLKVWVWCLLRANREPVKESIKCGKAVYEVQIERGQFITGRFSAADELQMKPETVRKRLKKLASLGNCTINSTSNYTIVTICKYEHYQSNEWQEHQQRYQGRTKDAPSEDQGRTTDNKGDNSNKENKKEEQPFPADAGDHVSDTGKKATKKPKAESKPREPNPYADAFKAAFDAAFPDVGGYDWQTADFVQLNRWRPKHPTVTPEQFAAVAKRHWGRGEYCPGAARSIKGLCSSWSQLAAWQEGLPINGTNTNRRPDERGVVPPSDYKDVKDGSFIPL